jgi:CheY-like chemotaxis protein
MDIQLPIMDGYAATRSIKAVPALRSIPIIAVTSYALSGEEKKARAARCDDYVPKALQPTSTTGENQAIPLLRWALIAAVHESGYGPSRQILRWNLMSAFGVLRTSCQRGTKRIGSE